MTDRQTTVFVLMACQSFLVLAIPWPRPATPNGIPDMHTNYRLVDDFVLGLYRNLTKGMPIEVVSGRRQLHFKHVDTVRSFPAIGSFEGPTHLAYEFDVTAAMSTTETLLAAEMRMALPDSWSRFRRAYATARRLATSGGFASSVSVVRLHSSVDGKGQAILVVDMTEIIMEVLQSFVQHDTTRDEHAVTIEITSMDAHHRKPSDLSKTHRTTSDPIADAILVAYTVEGTAPTMLAGYGRSRQKRRANGDEQNLVDILQRRNKSLRVVSPPSAQGPCRRREMDVDFADIGWGKWVVYPTHFNAFQCQGRCSSYADSRSNPTNHAIVQSLVQLVGIGEDDALPAACCAPTRLSPLSILYMEKGSVVIKHHEDMIVEECGCM